MLDVSLTNIQGQFFEGSNWNLDSKPDKFSVGVTFHTFFGGRWPNQCWKTPSKLKLQYFSVAKQFQSVR